MEIIRIIEHAENLLKTQPGERSSLAKTLGFSNRYIADIKAGKSKNPSPNFILALINKLNFNPLWLETGEGDMFLQNQEKSLVNTQKSGEGYKIPLLRQKVSCGPGIDWQDENNIVDYIDVFDQIPRLKIERLFALRVEGSSMLGAGIRNGDYVLFNSAIDQWPHNDGIYVIALDGDVYCKRIELDMTKIKIYSVRVADLEKAELMVTLDREDTSTADRLNVFGRVLYWIHPNLEE